jgi:hypothetical protein
MNLLIAEPQRETEIDRLRKLLHPTAIIAVIVWVFLFSLLFFSPTLGLGRIWKNKINDYYKIYPSFWIVVVATTLITFIVALVLDPALSKDIDTKWWYGLVFGGGLGLLISIVTIIVTGVHKWLYTKFYSTSEPESWGLTTLRCIYYIVMLIVAGWMLTALR